METRSFEKIGLVGRTGAGKSTLSLAFFRIIPFASGSIIIDDIDISKIGLNDLRKNLTIIPQDPVLFEGTLRWNLDPTETQAEADLYAALRNVGFTETLAIERFSLDMPVVEGGSNFSQGQRQLLCLARALVFKTSFLILDEATASVDTESDVKVQEAIRSAFKYTTILCIAHRLRTVIDYDRILVLDDGCVVEFDKPSLLIQKENGYLRKMCEESGEFEELMEIASSR